MKVAYFSETLKELEEAVYIGTHTMNQPPKSPVPVWYWGIAVVAVLWNLMGCAAFATELFAQEAVMESMTEP